MIDVIFFTIFYYFNPRTREGCDLEVLTDIIENIQISIHAPVKGATVARQATPASTPYFNPRTREGCDYKEAQANADVIIFQSTHP